jgi:hypothetical protein
MFPPSRREETTTYITDAAPDKRFFGKVQKTLLFGHGAAEAAGGNLKSSRRPAGDLSRSSGQGHGGTPFRLRYLMQRPTSPDAAGFSYPPGATGRPSKKIAS